MKLLKFASIVILAFLIIFIFINRDGKVLGKPYEAILKQYEIELDTVVHKVEKNNEIIVFFNSVIESRSSLGVIVLEKKFLRNYNMKDRGNYASSENSQLHVSYLKLFPLIYGEIKDEDIKSISMNGQGIEKKASIVKLSGKTIWYVEDIDFIPEDFIIKGYDDDGDIIYSNKNRTVFESTLRQLQSPLWILVRPKSRNGGAGITS